MGSASFDDNALEGERKTEQVGTAVFSLESIGRREKSCASRNCIFSLSLSLESIVMREKHCASRNCIFSLACRVCGSLECVVHSDVCGSFLSILEFVGCAVACGV